MTTFSNIEHLRPPGFVVVPPSAWASTWEERPREEVCIGLRFIPEADLEDARVEAYKRAERLFPAHAESADARELFAQSFNDALLRFIIARGTCDPNDVTQLWEPWSAAAEDIAVEQALTDKGAQLIFDTWEHMRLTGDIALPIASDEDIALLRELCVRLPVMAQQSRAREQRCRRLLRFVLEELETIEPPQPPPG